MNNTTQTIFLGFRAKTITIFASLHGSESYSNGVCDQSNNQVASVFTPQFGKLTVYAVVGLGDSNFDYYQAVVEEITADSVVLRWTLNGNAPIGTLAEMTILATTH